MILKDPDPKLHKVCSPCKFPSAKNIAIALFSEAEKATEEQKKHGNVVVGLAAPQIGLPKQAFLAMGKIFINPTIIYKSEEQITSREGCLSLENDAVIERKRSRHVDIVWSDPARKLRRASFEGSAAVVIQHEMDHLKGILCNETQE